MDILDIPNELLLWVGEDLSIKDPFHFLSTCRQLTSLLTPRLHKLGLQDVEDGLTALQWAAEHGKESLAELAISRGAEVNKPSKKLRGQAPLHSAAAGGRTRVIEILVAHGAAIGARVNHSQTPLRLAAVFGRAKAIKVLLKLGADMMCIDALGDTPAHSAYWDLDCIRAFIDAGFKINTKGHNGRTILHNAAECDREVLEYLLGQKKGKMAVNAQDFQGKTPLHLAKGIRAVRLLLFHGADAEVMDIDGTKCLDTYYDYW